ncbi:hypothetical protein AN640_08675 [Candidatus Epulonipiscium fishelsonii]|uniref:Uncharacterized protein n=1 Tax=Candidatus Epulonipiscium fishelsonii TaxID=77094 RepID=A0ACC8XCY2_9FIRM|nr:hypothetical protein AN640_08675 [Epulopiscium sp. SCG-D08WGA-EpuloA1]
MNKDMNKDLTKDIEPIGKIDLSPNAIANYWLMIILCVVVFKHMNFNVLEYLGIEYIAFLLILYLVSKYYRENYNNQLSVA